MTDFKKNIGKVAWYLKTHKDDFTSLSGCSNLWYDRNATPEQLEADISNCDNFTFAYCDQWQWFKKPYNKRKAIHTVRVLEFEKSDGIWQEVVTEKRESELLPA